MSLVEQAIARLRQPRVGEAGAAPKTAVRAPAPAEDPLEHTATLENTATLALRMPIDLAALRASGYLPEKEKDRQFADHYRRIKRPLIEKAMSGSDGAGDPRIMMVTSALPGDGKTFTSINLALSMALERDISVLLIDADVAKQHVSEIFGLREQQGLLDTLADEEVEPESLIIQTKLRGLSIMPAGRHVEGTAELLSSNRMRKVVAGLCARNSRRILLLDSAPLLITNEGRALVKIAGQVVLVVRAGHTPRQAVQAATALFDEAQAGGIILNQVKVGATESYYGYGNYGNYGGYGTEGTAS
jgi:protein-tyrosine kinase